MAKDLYKDLADEIEEALTWGRSVLGISDWVLKLDVGNVPPSWYSDEYARFSGYGGVRWQKTHKVADIWISPSLCAADDIPPVAAAFHELSHVHFADLGIADRVNLSGAVEFAHTRLGEVMLMAWRRKKRRHK